MTTDATAVSYGADARSGSREAIVPLGRFLFALIFVLSGLNNFSRLAMGYAASQGVPLASLLVPLSGILALAGGLSILLGYHARLGAWLIVLFLVPVTVMMHPFWAVNGGVEQHRPRTATVLATCRGTRRGTHPKSRKGGLPSCQA
jgi:uncharacterized membrane protein YphA (DoxX/SURF4 family)